MAGISFDPVVDVYDATRQLPPQLMDKAVRGLADLLSGDGPVLETGVGTGRFAIPLRARGVRVVGVDISLRMLERARAKGGGDLFLASATHLPFRDGAFHASLAIHVLHLVAAWRDVLRELARVTQARFVTIVESITTRSVGEDRAAPPGAGPGDAYHPIRRYHELAKTRGYEYDHPGLRPPDMIARSPPELRRAVGRHEETLGAETLLAPAATKSYSSQWAVPDDIHLAVMEELTREMAGRTFSRVTEVEIVAWTPDALRRI